MEGTQDDVEPRWGYDMGPRQLLFYRLLSWIFCLFLSKESTSFPPSFSLEATKSVKDNKFYTVRIESD